MQSTGLVNVPEALSAASRVAYLDELQWRVPHKIQEETFRTFRDFYRTLSENVPAHIRVLVSVREVHGERLLWQGCYVYSHHKQNMLTGEQTHEWLAGYRCNPCKRVYASEPRREWVVFDNPRFAASIDCYCPEGHLIRRLATGFPASAHPRLPYGALVSGRVVTPALR